MQSDTAITSVEHPREQHWARSQELFAQLSTVPSSEWDAQLRELAQGDRQLAYEVISLLIANQTSGAAPD